MTFSLESTLNSGATIYYRSLSFLCSSFSEALFALSFSFLSEYFVVGLLKESVDPTCSLCGVRNETVGHILTSCLKSLFQLILERHDEVVELVARAVLGQLGVWVKYKYHVKGAVYHKGGTSVVVDRPIVNDGEVAHHRPYIVVFQRNKVTLIDVAVAWDPTVTVREHEQRIKYQALVADIAGQCDPINLVQS